MKWSETAWEKAGPVFEKIITHPFVLGLASGSLPEEKFIRIRRGSRKGGARERGATFPKSGPQDPERQSRKTM